MSDRIIRDELLTSERYWACSPEARNLFVSILLSVDDAARYTGSPFALRTRCMAGTVSHERIIAILAELVDANLVVRYEDQGQPYLFVPRFRNRRRYVSSSKYPAPPKEINDINSEKDDLSQPKDVLKADSGLTQDRRGRGRGRGRGKSTPMAEPEGFGRWWAAYPKHVKKADAIKAWAKLAPDLALRERMLSVLSVQVESEQWRKDSGQFVPYPTTYLNGRRWEDEIATARQRVVE